nr:immunoglobulin heavy chain junction region [Macaca mulatta]MOX62089.1 immunoglobulin heavy chain junction region [Macaca mulatta]MOX65915.1 immunoglobulin heavy chain junction region [Macaca mulatta]MOX68347.1 immunoglobulin heavy chain junction region [Macaca mulatta]MOY24353.1 immunoglobulin heavy chain junction region [Macaca mulatta]
CASGRRQLDLDYW